MNSIGKLSISNLPSVFFDGVYRVLACIPETEDSKKDFPKFSVQNLTNFGSTVVDPTQWQETDLQWYNAPIWDQGATSSCVGHGTTVGMEYAYAQSGRKLVEYNPFFVYGLINNGRDAGAMVSDGLKALMQYGTCPHADLQSGMMFQNQFPTQAFTDALQYKLENAFHCQTFEDICSAISLGFVCPLGLYVDRNFANLDNEGVSGLPQQGAGGGHCVKPETLISGPVIKKAEDVKVNDLVFGHDGEIHKVEEVFKRYYNGNLVKISSGGNVSVTTTEDHPILIYRRARQKIPLELTYGYLESHESKSHYRSWEKFDSIWVTAKDVRPGDFILTPKLKLNNHIEIPDWVECDKQSVMPSRLIPSKDLAWLIGYFIGDGSTHKKTFELIFAKKDENLVQKALKILSGLGVNPKIKIKTEKYIKVRVSSSVLAKSFREWFGAYSHEKHIADWLFSDQWDLSSLLEGLMDADGCKYKGYNIFSTVSPILTQQVRLIAATLGNRPSGSIARHSKGTYSNARESYIVKWIDGKQKMIRDTEDFILAPVKSVLMLPYSGDVYNFEVEECHSYLADTIIVHNCILGMGLKKSARYGWLIKAQNSWGVRFGMNGFSYIHKGHLQMMQPDAFAVQSVIDAVQDNDPPDVKGDI